MTMQRTVLDTSDCSVHAEAIITNTSPMNIEGVPFFPAHEINFGRALSLKANDMAVQVNMQAVSPIGNRLGLYVQLTPDGAREMAASLLRQAELVDAHVAAQAAAAIEAARKGGAQ